LRVTMVIIFLKTLEKKKGVDDVRSNNTERRPHKFHSMSKGTTLLSRGTVEADRWLDLGQSCAVQRRAPCQPGASLGSLWGPMPGPGGWPWAKEPGSASAITSLIRDLSLSTTCRAPTAPPSKRQCRSLSLSDELTGFRSSWRPQGSRVWTTVEKRRCHSGGSVRGAAQSFSGGHPPAMQRSSSLSLPSRPSVPSDGAMELAFFHQPLPPQPLSLSHEQISLPELQREEEASEASSPDSTPELGRRAGPRARPVGRLSRSKSQPCVLNDKRVAVKRRRPEEPRPSLDLAKMNQNRQTFQSLSCPGFSAADGRQPGLPPPSSRRPDSDFTAASESGVDSRKGAAGGDGEEDSSFEELDSDSACSVDSRPCTPVGPAGGKGALWKGATRRDIFQLGGELDLDQIERN
uniref:Family with sequence similarity 53 member B n=1 Tax=Gasterosteus aculeatus TaxID=69293 RepID=G3P5B3_GASAC